MTPDRASIEHIDARGVELAVVLALTNNNPEDLSVQGLTAHVVVDGRFDVGRITVKQSVALPAGKPTKMTVPVFVKWKDAAPLIELGASDRPVPYVVDGLVLIGGAGVSLDVPYSLKGSMPHEEIVRAARRSL